MKKVIVLFITIITMIFSLLLLASCDMGEPKSAIDVWNRVDKKMTSLSSYEARMDMSMKMFINGSAVSTSADSTIIEHNIGKRSSYYYYEKTDMRVTNVSNGAKINSESTEEYRDGNLFVTNSSGGKASKLYNTMTKSEFLEYKNSKAIDLESEFGFDKAGYSEFSQDEYGCWKIKFSEFSDEAIETISKMVGVEDSVVALTIEDVKFTIRADADFLATRIDITFVFEENENEDEQASIKIAVDYNKINEAEPKKEIPNVSEYLEVDFKELDKIDRMIKEYEKIDEGSFKFETGQKLIVLENTTEYGEKNEVSYGEKDGKFFYEITSTVDKEKFTITYSDGTQSINREKGSSETKAQTEKEARAYVRTLMSGTGYNRQYVTEINQTTDEYVLKCDAADISQYRQVFESLGGHFKDLNQTVTIKIKDGKIIRITTEIIAEGEIRYSDYKGTHSIPLKMTVVSRLLLNDMY